MDQARTARRSHGDNLPKEQWRRRRQIEEEIGPRPTPQASEDATRHDGKHQNGGEGGKESHYWVPLGRSTVRRSHPFSDCVGEPSRAGGGRSRTASTGCESCDSTGAKSTGRFGGVHRSGGEGYEEVFLTWKSPWTDSGYRGPGGAPEHRGGAKGQAATILGPEFGKRDPPVRHYLYEIQTLPP